MLFDTYATQAAEASLDTLWLKTQVISNNMSNVDTPGFKASSVSFEDMLTRARAKNVEGKEVDTGRAGASGVFRARVSQDETSAVRLDGNNVVLEQQQSELWKTYAQYSYLLDRVNGHYSTINAAISGMQT